MCIGEGPFRLSAKPTLRKITGPPWCTVCTELILGIILCPPCFFKSFLFLSHVFIIHTVLLYHMWGGEMNI